MAKWRPWSNEPELVATIDDTAWRELQVRALRANPRLADSFSTESADRSRAAAEQFKNRRMN